MSDFKAEENWNPYRYHATVDQHTDGDTIVLMIDLGLNSFVKEPVRLNRINAPEVKGVEKLLGKAAHEYLKILLPIGMRIQVQTIKDRKEKYGRYLAEVWTESGNVSDLMVHAGHAAYKSY